MKTADIIRTQLKAIKTPGKPVDTDMLIEAIGAAIDMKVARLNIRVTDLEAKHMREDG